MKRITTRVVVATGKRPIFRRRPDGTNDYGPGEALSVQDLNQLGQDKLQQLLDYNFLREEAREVEV